ncbi:MAG: redoxin domain-containing protein, partial [Planctomycetaceae bacterium]|nr:redoxin domain-containing protein [Planctomycetaceae bacterium]
MSKQSFAIVPLVALWLAAGSAAPLRATEANLEPARFLTAIDLEGKLHRLAEGESDRVTAVVFITTECPIAREYIPELNRLAAQFGERGVKFFGAIYEPSASRAAARKFQEEFQIAFPVLFDASGELFESLRPTRVPEAFVISTTGAVLYRGRIDDRYGEVGKKRSAPTTHELADALTSVLAGKAVAVAETTPVGCPLESRRTAEGSQAVTYNRDIAPIVFAQCAECHRPGEVAPFSLLSYEDVSKRAEHIAEVTGQRLMPPWKAKIGHGRFLGERQLTESQVALIAAWAKAGAPEGDPADLPPQPKFASGWRLGEPDLVVKAPTPFEVPADGPDVFQHFIIPLEDAAGRTVVGFEFRPGNPAVVHHAILFLDTSGVGRQKDEATPEPGYTTSGSIDIPVAGMLGVWTPGMTPRFYTKNIGMPIKPKTDLVLQLHLHPSGKVESDQSSIALYYAKPGEEPTNSTTIFVVGSLLIDIEAGKNDHTVKSSVTLPADMTLVTLLPHMHLIGKEMK